VLRAYDIGLSLAIAPMVIILMNIIYSVSA
jgi:hypothetical protein